jgi:hypothetical protein
LDIDGDQLTEYLNIRSPVFFAEAPSADFELIEKQRGAAHRR